MRLFKLRYLAAAILGSLVAAVALTQTGCLRTQPSSADEMGPASQSRPAARSPAGRQPAGRKSAESDKLEQPLLRELGEALDNAPDLERSDRDEAWRILKEADPILTRIKEENRKGIEAANQPPQLKRQGSHKPKPAEDAPQAKDQEPPEA